MIFWIYELQSVNGVNAEGLFFVLEQKPFAESGRIQFLTREEVAQLLS